MSASHTGSGNANNARQRNRWLIFLVAALIAGGAVWGLSYSTGLIAVLQGLFRKPKAIILADRTRTEWQALTATKLLLDQGQGPTTAQTAVFINAEKVKEFTKRFEGLKAQFIGSQSALSGSTITVKQFSVTPSLGSLDAIVSLTGYSPKLGLTLGVQVQAVGRYEGTLPAGTTLPNQMRPTALPIAKFKWVPLTISPAINWGPLNVKANGFAAALLAQTAELFSKPENFVTYVSMAAPLSTEFGLEHPQEQTVAISGSQGSLTVRESMPPYKLDSGIVDAAPIFTDYGIWLILRHETDNTALPPPPNIPNVSTDELERQVSVIRAAIGPTLGSANPGQVDFRVFINSSVFSQAITALNAVPPPSRTATFQVTGHQGKLAEKTLHDDVLGSLSAYAQIASDSDTHATVSIGNFSGGWSQNGLSLSAPVDAHVNASVDFHVTPPISGGFGTTIGITGNASQTLSITATPKVFADNGVSSVAILPTVPCTQIPINAMTDGILKVDFGWMSVPSVGVKMSIPAFNHPQAPASLLDSRPLFISVLPADEKDRIHWDHPVPYSKLIITSRNLMTTDSGIQFDGSITLVDLPQPATEDGDRAAQLAVEQEANSVAAKVSKLMQANLAAATSCPPPGDFELVIGPLQIGPNNEIVKFITNTVNDIVNGPSDSNDLVKAGYYAGSVLKQIDPTNALGQQFLDQSRVAAKNTFGEHSVVYTAVDHLDQEVTNVLTNPAKAALDLPSDVVKSVGTFGNQAQQALSDAQKAVANIAPGSNIHLQVGSGGVSAGVGNTNICIGCGGVHVNVAGVHIF